MATTGARPASPHPGNENALTGVAPAPAPILLSAPPPCLLADTVPAPFREAECNGFGSDMYDRTYWDEPLHRALHPAGPAAQVEDHPGVTRTRTL